ncbi:hypothetical protein TNCV_2768841 [Trichonephila clavipes]|nr:hypothetical protein TNCV_2768841 [Trichonephila clavipes]
MRGRGDSSALKHRIIHWKDTMSSFQINPGSACNIMRDRSVSGKRMWHACTLYRDTDAGYTIRTPFDPIVDNRNK